MIELRVIVWRIAIEIALAQVIRRLLRNCRQKRAHPPSCHVNTATAAGLMKAGSGGKDQFLTVVCWNIVRAISGIQ